MMSLFCLVYTSVATQKMSDDDLKELLKKSRIKNERLNVTGMLLYLDPFFIQVLEGEESVITDFFNTIKNDARHRKVSLIYKKPIEERCFLNWTMGFNRVSKEDLETIEGFSDFWQRPTSDFFKNSPAAIKNIFEMFRNETLF